MGSLAVPFDPASAALVRRRMSVELLSRGIPVDVVDDAALVLSELVGNAVRHGAPVPGGGLWVAWTVHDTTVRVEVADGGPGVPAVLPARSVRPGGGAVDDVESGRGLTIVDRLARSWGSCGGTVWADLHVQEFTTAAWDADEELRQA